MNLTKHPSEYLLAIKPDGKLVRHLGDIPDEFANLDNTKSRNFKYYKTNGSLREEYWALPRYPWSNYAKTEK